MIRYFLAAALWLVVLPLGLLLVTA